ncbi:MAG: hypothetical protein Q9166_001294 [cf. Caloplaca sp. 2 TL-2023]
MASTRQIHIYEDPSTKCHVVSHSQESLLQPSIPNSHGLSPLKPGQPRSTPPKACCGPLKGVSLPPPAEKSSYKHTDELQKPSHFAPYYPAVLPPSDTAVFGDLPHFHHVGQANVRHTQHSDNCAAFPDPGDDHLPPKSGQMTADIVPRQRRVSKAAPHEAPLQLHLPDPDELPTPEDNHEKPNYSYASLIGMSILRAHNRRLTLSQIYKWISDTFSYYRISEPGWQNSIRHNLSINKAFMKQERPKDDPGKGNYWIIKPGMEAPFLKEKPSRRPPSAGGPAMKTFSQPLNEPSSSAWSTSANAAPKPVQQAPAVPEQPSSDGTIPLSDVISAEDFEEEITAVPPVSRLLMSSPSPAIGSSPPVALRTDADEGSPYLASAFLLPSAQPQTKKRNFAAMDDSGYFSSLDSSVTKGCTDMEADKPRRKRGRAEEEIARIRSSSHDLSPTKGRSVMKPLAPLLASSSPLPDVEIYLMPPPPLTPGVVPIQPTLAPASISPTTNLRYHRDFVDRKYGSPARKMDILNDEILPSPNFKLDEYISELPDESHSSYIFNDNALHCYSRPLSASPKKRSARRSRLGRPGKTSNVLVNMTGAQLNRMMLPPSLQAPYIESPTRKTAASMYPLDQENRDSPIIGNIFDSLLYDDNDEDEKEEEVFVGLDITKGFPEIGRNQTPTSKVQKAVRPLLGARNHTSRF